MYGLLKKVCQAYLEVRYISNSHEVIQVEVLNFIYESVRLKISAIVVTKRYIEANVNNSSKLIKKLNLGNHYSKNLSPKVLPIKSSENI